MANIKVFARLKPCQTNHGSIRREDQTLFVSSLSGQACAKTTEKAVEHHHESKSLRFGFAHIFNMESSQKDVFDVAAKDIVKAFLEGFNGTIFAYGQTGSGKTFTIQGDGNDSDAVHRSGNPGLIPQSLSLVSREVHHAQSETVNIRVSFLEIYKETAYDLLGPLLYSGEKGKDLPKVLVTLGANGSCHLHGLSSHVVSSESEATKLYHLGVANRQTAQTPSNERSSRSHTVFTIALSRQKHGSDLITRSKLHLVDLAGSERVWKTSVDDQRLTEAKFINLSLHHLESVIIALQRFSLRSTRNHSKKKQTGKGPRQISSATVNRANSMDCVSLSRLSKRYKSASASDLRKTKQSAVVSDNETGYVPYRNSLLTMVLQDSLGGNCNTAMIATLSLEETNVCETISTCRFAQRVARIINKPIRNEEVDKNAVIKRLQIKLAKLHLELAAYKSAQQETCMLCGGASESYVDEQACADVMDCFLVGRINDPVAHGINTPRSFRVSLRYLRQMIFEAQSQVLPTRHRDEALESADDQDSGVRTNSEPTSPLTSEGESDGILVSNFIALSPTVFSPAGSEHRSSLSRDGEPHHEEPTPTTTNHFPGPSEILQPQGTGRSEASTQTGLLTSFEDTSHGASDDRAVCLERGRPRADAENNFVVWEIELQKEALLNKSKILASRLADQRARLVVMLRQGAFPEEVENEKIAELQLQKKQREVKQKLFAVIKQLAEWKTNRLQQSQEKQQQVKATEHRPYTAAGASQINENHRPGPAAQTVKELQLKERSTRQKLLARRELMKNVYFAAPTTLTPQASPCQSAVSTSSCRFETGQTSLSTTSSMTLWGDEGRVGGDQCGNTSHNTSHTATPLPSLCGRNIVTKSTRLKSHVDRNSYHGNKPSLNPQSAHSTRGFWVRGKLLANFANRDSSKTLDDTRNHRLVDYIKNCHQAVYHKSTFPQHVRSVSRSVKYESAKGKESLQTAEAIDKIHHQENSRKVCTEKEKGSEAILQDCRIDSVLSKVTNTVRREEGSMWEKNDAVTHRQENQNLHCEDLNSQYHSLSLTSESTNKIPEQTRSTLTHLKREQQQRVKKIRQCVNAAEVIQLSWRRYRRRKDHESNR